MAGLLSGLVEGLPWPDRLARAVALSAATVRAPAAGEFDEEVYAELLPRVKVTEYGRARTGLTDCGTSGRMGGRRRRPGDARHGAVAVTRGAAVNA